MLGIDFKPGNTGNGKNGNPAFVLTGHSSSLVTHFTSAINPRAIIFTPPSSTGRVNTPAAARELRRDGLRARRAVRRADLERPDRERRRRRSQLLPVPLQRSPATARPPAAPSIDLLTPKIESGFSDYSLYQDVDIKNTIFDCLQCHQTAGPGTTKILRQQELQNPWGHFFRNNRSNGQALLADYAAAHPVTEAYGGIPGAAITNSDPAQLEGLVENQGFQKQPNEFITNKILDLGPTATWTGSLQQLDDVGRTSRSPYHENRVTDPTKLATATTAYTAAMAGTPLSMDIRDVFLDSAAQDMTFRPNASLVAAGDGAGIMKQICQQCHNPSLDQTQTRAKFDVTKLATMSREEKDKAILRLGLEPTAFRRMPPPRFRGLSADEVAIVTAELQK